MRRIPRKWMLAKQLCKEMGWTDDWSVCTKPLKIKKLEELLKRLGVEPVKKRQAGEK